MELEGQVQDVSLPEVFRLLRMTTKTGVLTVQSGRKRGEVYLCDGQIFYAQCTFGGVPLGERLVKAGALRRSDLTALLGEQRAAPRPRQLSALLKEKGLVHEEDLERYVREQIEDSVFNLFDLTSAEFQFMPIEAPPREDVVVLVDTESAVIEGSRRVDEWSIIMGGLGSLEKVPCLVRTSRADVALRRQEWDVICYIDGRRDINTIVVESGFDRFRTAKTIYRLLTMGLLVTRDPTLELLGQKTAVALKGPIDVYNRMFLTAVCTSEPSSHLRVEVVDDEEVEVKIVAGVREDDHGGVLVYAGEARAPLTVIRRMALETSGYVVLVNINSRDAVVASRADIALMAEIGDRPYVVAAYASLVDEQVVERQVRELLELPVSVPVVSTGLRDPEETSVVMEALMALIP